MKDGRAKNGTEDQSPDGISHQEVKVVRVRTIRGTPPGQRESGEISAEMDAVETAVKEKSNTWHKSCKESTMRETELFKMVEVAVTDEKQEERERGMIRGSFAERGKKRTKQGT